jgi:mannitol/fructose-specific phosphotransferase system IIA component (Ntr-type)
VGGAQPLLETIRNLSKENWCMKFADFVSPEAIRADLAADDKEGVIRELVQALLDAGKIEASEQDSIVKAILSREELGSTGIGRGVAVPHTKHSSVEQLIGTVGVSREGVDFDSLDGEKVFVLFLLVSPLDRPGDHLRALENIARQLRDDRFCRFLKQATTPAEIRQLLSEADGNQFGS